MIYWLLDWCRFSSCGWWKIEGFKGLKCFVCCVWEIEVWSVIFIVEVDNVVVDCLMSNLFVG